MPTMAPENMFMTSVRSFWHTMTSYDRHASHDSPYRTGRHIPLPQSRNAPLTSVATSAFESRQDLSTSYAQDEPGSSNGFIGSPPGPLSPRSPYSPGSRSNLARQSSDHGKGANGTTTGEIPMQNFSDGLPPPPPVGHSWKRIERWLEDRYEELFDQTCEGCTQNDVNELEHELDCTLPMDVRDSLQIHDGQERGGLPTGLIFGMMLLDCEEIVQEWQNWRVVADEYLNRKPDLQTPQVPNKAFAGAGPSSGSISPPPAQGGNPMWRQELLNKQDSQPTGAIQKAYSHPAWIPVARDWGGNYLAVDLAPGPAGKWGQVIIFGRDYDCKYVVARSWGHFLATFADDLSSDKVHIDEDTNELKLLEFKKQNVEPPYLEILRWRCDQKYGRKPRRRPPPGNGGLNINSGVAGRSGSVDSSGSPYGSPTSTSDDRGRSMNRFKPKGPSASPRANISSPLARVAEEAPAPIRIQTNVKLASQEENLLSSITPRPSTDMPSPIKPTLLSPDRKENDKEQKVEDKKVEDKKTEVTDGDDLKTVEI